MYSTKTVAEKKWAGSFLNWLEVYAFVCRRPGVQFLVYQESIPTPPRTAQSDPKHWVGNSQIHVWNGKQKTNKKIRGEGPGPSLESAKGMAPRIIHWACQEWPLEAAKNKPWAVLGVVKKVNKNGRNVQKWKKYSADSTARKGTI